jgi:hypothetical protein
MKGLNNPTNIKKHGKTLRFHRWLFDPVEPAVFVSVASVGRKLARSARD